MRFMEIHSDSQGDLPCHCLWMQHDDSAHSKPSGDRVRQYSRHIRQTWHYNQTLGEADDTNRDYRVNYVPMKTTLQVLFETTEIHARTSESICN